MRSKRVVVVALAAVLVLLVSWSTGRADASLFDPESLVEEAPDEFSVRFETSKGEFVVAVTREWAPLGADRFYNLVKHGFYDGVRFFRVVEGYVVQFGIHGNPRLSRIWREATIQDDPVVSRNRRGTIAFATAGKNSRTTQLFINLAGNTQLGALGFAPFGRVVEGMVWVVDELYAGYGDELTRQQHQIGSRGNAYLEREFPHLDQIERATLIE